MMPSPLPINHAASGVPCNPERVLLDRGLDVGKKVGICFIGSYFKFFR
jgi:hypothetical protein